MKIVLISWEWVVAHHHIWAWVVAVKMRQSCQWVAFFSRRDSRHLDLVSRAVFC